MAESNARTEAFEVPDCILPTSVAPGDVIVRTTGAEGVVEFSCHSVILYYGSDYFKTLLSGDWKETRGDKSAEAAAPGSVSVFIRATIDLFDESPQTFLQVLNHLYPKLSLKLSEANWQDVWRLADKLDLADLVALCEKYMGDKVLHVDPLTVLAWARRNTRKEWYRKSSEVVLDRVASGQIADLSAMPVSLQLALMTKRFHMLRNIFSFADQVRQIMDLLPQSALFEWDQVAKEAAAKPSRAAAVRLLQAATGLNTRYPYSRAPTSSQTLSKLIERFRPLIDSWSLDLPVDDRVDNSVDVSDDDSDDDPVPVWRKGRRDNLVKDTLQPRATIETRATKKARTKA